MGKKVIAAGHICLDITPVFRESNKPCAAVGDLLKPGQLLQMGKADVHTGGAVANCGLAMKLLGADVSLMGKIGDDAFGVMVKSILSRYGADKEMIVSEAESTSYSVVLAIPGIDRIFLHNPGANDTFCAEDIPDEALCDAALFHLGYPPLMAGMYAKEGEELLCILKKAKAKGAAVSLDMAAVDPLSEAGRVDWEGILKKTLPYVDFFVPSVEELCYMLDKERLDEWKERARGGDVTEILNWKEDVRPLADKCMDMGAKVLLVKCGAPGLYIRTADKSVLKKIPEKVGLDAETWACKEWFEKSYVPDKVLSATGAGDTSIAAFLTSVLTEETPEMSMKLAAAAGASCVEAYDALSGLKTFEELKKKIAAGWAKV